MVAAALGFISRRGLGKVRHLDTSQLWIQQVAATKGLEFNKVSGAANPAHLMTKELPAIEINKCVDKIGAQFMEARPEIAARIAEDIVANDLSEAERGGREESLRPPGGIIGCPGASHCQI